MQQWAGSSGAGSTAVASAAPAAVVVDVTEAANLGSAQEYARREGHRVEVTSLRAEASTTYANVDGSLTTEFVTQPIRVRRGDGWVPVDTTLVADAAGVHPRAVPGSLVLSAGGGSTLATISAGGRSSGLRWAAALPKPRLAGDTATYPDVAAGVDLTVTATRVGFEVSFVLKTRPANAGGVFRLPLLSGLTADDPDQGRRCQRQRAPRPWSGPAGGDV